MLERYYFYPAITMIKLNLSLKHISIGMKSFFNYIAPKMIWLNILKNVAIYLFIVKRGKNGTNLTNLSIICYLLWPSLSHFFALIHWSLTFMNK